MIPKVIHYCWFGKNKMPPKTQKYIESWKKKCPDYEIFLWDESNFDVNLNNYTKSAYDAKKWAFVSDVARLYALKHYGGVYLDTDVELLENFDSFLECNAFIGTERLKDDGSAQLSTATIGSVKDGEWVSKMLSDYEEREFVKEDNSLDLTPNTKTLTKLTFGNNSILDEKIMRTDIIVWPSDYFSPKNFFDSRLNLTQNTVAVHHFEGGWIPASIKLRIIVRRFIQRYFR
ncbi:glycosyltransferase family 32 protein [Vibrio harveyi]|nr:hypothetical protein [Vibrio harveyi]HEQ3594965.1 hypothetical protein [Vibrio harveyi]HEQ3606886.1 hypothetical protein [Vibrio harveyi]